MKKTALSLTAVAAAVFLALGTDDAAATGNHLCRSHSWHPSCQENGGNEQHQNQGQRQQQQQRQGQRQDTTVGVDVRNDVVNTNRNTNTNTAISGSRSDANARSNSRSDALATGGDARSTSRATGGRGGDANAHTGNNTNTITFEDVAQAPHLVMQNTGGGGRMCAPNQFLLSLGGLPQAGGLGVSTNSRWCIDRETALQVAALGAASGDNLTIAVGLRTLGEQMPALMRSLNIVANNGLLPCVQGRNLSPVILSQRLECGN